MNILRISLCKGQGGKICPFVDIDVATKPHCQVTREDLVRRVQQSNFSQYSPSSRVFQKTISLWAAFCKEGCGAPPYKDTLLNKVEEQQHTRWNAQMEAGRRGHEAKPTCQGRLVFEYNSAGKALVRYVVADFRLTWQLASELHSSCEHYDPEVSRDHLINFEVGNGLYDEEYLEALFGENKDLVDEIEEDAAVGGLGPRVHCTTMSNFSSVKVNCRALNIY